MSGFIRKRDSLYVNVYDVEYVFLLKKMSDIKCIGIDLGTSTTIVSYIDEFGYTKYISQGSCNFQNSVVNVSCINGESFQTGVGELEDVNGVLYATETKRIIGKR